MRTIFLIVLLLLCSAISYGQMMPMTSTIRTPYGNVPYTYNVYSPRNYRTSGNISVKYEFLVKLKNDSTFTAKTRIDISKDKHSITVKRNKEKIEITPSETESITRLIPYEGRKVTGIPADTCWLFKIGVGKIISYSFLAEDNMQFITAIQHGDGPIVPLTKNNLKEMIGEDPELLKLIEKNKLIKVIEKYNKSGL
ncbi:MAG TPA: hypothetical protein VL443_21765 [Cyclobacteriaceae bacterium]|jgi:hypothetical protein|nr:hypothetical protein [Cyclobacteriaceae bacterium]